MSFINGRNKCKYSVINVCQKLLIQFSAKTIQTIQNIFEKLALGGALSVQVYAKQTL